ncbi:GL24540 [Drosophila persimilis]|uniref:GL24540 n=1 Tax=Drosophila persimilis TaxID=7234 RepID=B4G4J4_DROPE|nr:GL24540 [Drosophila persimilis]
MEMSRVEIRLVCDGVLNLLEPTRTDYRDLGRELVQLCPEEWNWRRSGEVQVNWVDKSKVVAALVLSEEIQRNEGRAHGDENFNSIEQ